ncbi:MAG: hypothetical protein NT062_25665 [Proteobacteria bacterium]|nr:hypothetical protein [Pseudomonadota bacterium]
MKRFAFVVAALAACGVRAPAALDVASLVRTRGADEARLELVARILADPRDVQARLALAALVERDRPAEAIAQLETVERLGGPIGVRWHADDRARLGRLLAQRGDRRTLRSSPTALADLRRAQGYGATIDPWAIATAHLTHAMADLAHVDPGIRARGRDELAFARAATDETEQLYQGSRRGAARTDSAAFAAATHASYLRALAWWSPIWTGEAAPPSSEELVGAERCRFAACRARDATGDASAEAAFVAALEAPPIRDPEDAAAFLAIALRAAHASGQGFGQLVAARLDLAALAGGDPVGKPFPDLRGPARVVLARLVGLGATRLAGPSDAELAAASRDDQLLGAVARLLDGAPPPRILAAFAEGHPDADWFATQFELRDDELGEATSEDAGHDWQAGAVVAYVQRVASGARSLRSVEELVATYRRSPAAGERVARDLVAASDDGALGQAVCGAVFTALGDPARARTAWQAAVEQSPEPRYLARLAEAIARAGDGDAALVAATQATAASGDPAVTWLGVARVLESVGLHVFALEASRQALDLAGANTIVPTLEVASTTSRALGRDAQAATFDRQRARLEHPPLAASLDPTDPRAAVTAYRAAPTAGTIARMWVASRWAWADVAVRVELYGALATSDARRAVIGRELARLAGRDVEQGSTVSATIFSALR